MIAPSARDGWTTKAQIDIPHSNRSDRIGTIRFTSGWCEGESQVRYAGQFFAAPDCEDRLQRLLEKSRLSAHTSLMTNKEIVQDLLRRIPDDASLQDIARELEFIAAVRQGVSELDNGESVAIEEVEQELPSWIIK